MKLAWFPPLGRIRLQWHLVALVVGTLLPVLVFSATIVLRLADEERSAHERRLLELADLLATATERELEATIRTLEAMAESERLDRGALADFHAEMSRIQSTQPTWLLVLLVSPEGQQLVNTGVPWGTPLPAVVEPDSLQRLVETGRPTVGDLAKGSGGTWAFPVRVPVLRGGQLRYVLTAVLRPHALVDVVGREPFPDEWTRTVVDRRGVVTARSRDTARYVGEPATASFVDHTREGSSGSFRSTTLEGAAAYVAWSRVPSAGWTAAVAVPVEGMDGPLRRSMLTVTGVGLLMLLASGAGAFFLSRRVSRDIARATSAADALVDGERPRVLPSSIDEVARLADALVLAADLLAQRERERDEHLARAEKARAEAEAESLAKDEFLAMLGHELRNPLSPIVMALELLELSGQAQTREHQIIGRQVQHLIRLVDDLLDVSRITRGKVDLQKEPIEVSTIVARALEMATPLLDQRRHTLTVDVPRTGLRVDGDPVRLAQVLGNLLTNAAKYTRSGGRVRVSARNERDAIVLSVTDDGEGISAELLPRVFEAFVQAPRTPDRQQGGLGLGLTLVRSLVVLHGGRVEAHSDGRGKGSTFVVTLPAIRALTSSTPETGEDLSMQVGARKLRVLIVDDNVDAAELLGQLLATHQHTIAIAHDGAAALVALEAFTPDLAVLDIGLPVLDGYALAARIRDKLGAAAPIFVAVTGYGQENDRAKSLAAGFQRHFVKPVDPAAFLAAIEELAAARFG